MTEISDWSDIEAQLQETKGLLEEIEQRFHQVRRDSLKQNELRSQKEQIREQIQDISSDRLASNKNQKIRRKPNSRNDRSSPHKEELLKQLDAVTEQLEQIEADLENHEGIAHFLFPLWLVDPLEIYQAHRWVYTKVAY